MQRINVAKVVKSVETTSPTGMPEAAENNKAAKEAVEALLDRYCIRFQEVKRGNLSYYYLPRKDIYISVRFDSGKAQAAYSNFAFYDLAAFDRGIFFLVAKGENKRCLDILNTVIEKCDATYGNKHVVVINDSISLLGAIGGFNGQ